mgnify:CR=1 FL=1
MIFGVNERRRHMNAQTNVNNSGQKIRTVDITVTAAMAALVFLGTYIFKIPTISGYVHLGDCMIILTVALFGMKKGCRCYRWRII